MNAKPPILCLPTELLFGSTNERYLHGFAGPGLLHNLVIRDEDAVWADRDEAEKDPSLKQIIPYVALYHKQTDSFFTYRRGKAGAEARLHDKRSIGVGGHIDGEDPTKESLHLPKAIRMPDARDFEDHIFEAGIRELDEEVKLELNGNQLMHMIGYVNEHEKEVGRVHFGVCFFISLTNKQYSTITSNELCIKDPRFVESKVLLETIDEYELWSQFFIRALVLNPTTVAQLA
jgi:predicted NUDIX family phosphoesterase